MNPIRAKSNVPPMHNPADSVHVITSEVLRLNGNPEW